MIAKSSVMLAATLLVVSLSLPAAAHADDDLPVDPGVAETAPPEPLPPIPIGFPDDPAPEPPEPPAPVALPAPAPPPDLAPAPAPPPHAYSVNWDRVARCESGGNWAIHTGNGYEGGVQFLNSTWLSVKAPGDPPHAYQASREQQMDAAERLLHRSGIGQWPVCGRS